MIHLRRLENGLIEVWDDDRPISTMTKPQALQFLVEHYGRMPSEAVRYIFDKETVINVGELLQ